MTDTGKGADTITPPDATNVTQPPGANTGESTNPPEPVTNGEPKTEPKPPELPKVPDSDDSKLEKNAAYYARHPEELVAVFDRAQEINPDAFIEKGAASKSEAEINAAIQGVRLENLMELAFRDAAIEHPELSVEDVKIMKADTPEQVKANAKWLAERLGYERAKDKVGDDVGDGDAPAKPDHLTKDGPDSGRLDKQISVDNKGGITLPAPSDNPATDLEQASANFDKALGEMNISDLTGKE